MQRPRDGPARGAGQIQLEKHLTRNMPYTVPSDWVQETLIPTMRNTVQDVLATAMPRLRLNGNNFELLGFDFLIDRQLNVRLLECNTNPALFVDSAAHQAVIPSLLAETLDIVIEAQVSAISTECKPVCPH